MNKQITQKITLFALSMGFMISCIPLETTATAIDVADVVNQEAVIDGEQFDEIETMPVAGVEKALQPDERILELQQKLYDLEQEKKQLERENELLEKENEELKKF